MIILYHTKNQKLIFNHFPTTKRGIKVLKQGIYEQIINQKLKNELMTFDTTYEIGTEPIDVEEARKMLSSYISQVTRRALRFVRENESDDKIALLQQIKTCNSIIAILSQELDEQEFLFPSDCRRRTSVNTHLLENELNQKHHEGFHDSPSHSDVRKLTFYRFPLRTKYVRGIEKRNSNL